MPRSRASEPFQPPTWWLFRAAQNGITSQRLMVGAGGPRQPVAWDGPAGAEKAPADKKARSSCGHMLENLVLGVQSALTCGFPALPEPGVVSRMSQMIPRRRLHTHFSLRRASLPSRCEDH